MDYRQKLWKCGKLKAEQRFHQAAKSKSVGINRLLSRHLTHFGKPLAMIFTKARLLSSLAPHAGDWLNAVPITAVGLRLTNEALRV